MNKDSFVSCRLIIFLFTRSRMGKKKNKNKVSGAVKTAAKTEKKLASKLKKELANLGEVSCTCRCLFTCKVLLIFTIM